MRTPTMPMNKMVKEAAVQALAAVIMKKFIFIC